MISFEQCRRLFRFYEASALYELYYRKLDDSLGRNSTPALEEDRPLTWVPLVFHCTTLKALAGILCDGKIHLGEDKTYVSLTELPIVDLSRLRSLGGRVSEVAIGFPRVVLEAKGLFQPAYLIHASNAVKDAFRNLPSVYVELDDDLGALHEVRMPGSIPLDDAVYILSSVRDEQTEEFNHPVLRACMDRGFAISFWHPDDQREMIQEPTFRKETRVQNGCLISFDSRGEYYLPQSAKREFAAFKPKRTQEIEKRVILPVGKSFNLRFPSTAHLAKTSSDGWIGPFTKIDMAEYFINELRNQFPDEATKLQTRVQF
jgi:hypothetical protein